MIILNLMLIVKNVNFQKFLLKGNIFCQEKSIDIYVYYASIKINVILNIRLKK